VGPHAVDMSALNACVKDPYYHVSKDRTFLTYPDAQDTADRLRAIRAVAEPMKKMKTTWPLTTYNQPGARAVSATGGGWHNGAAPLVSATAGQVLCPPAHDAVPESTYTWSHDHVYYGGATVAVARGPAWVAAVSAAPRLRSDDPHRADLFWGRGCGGGSTGSRLSQSRSFGGRVHTSAWHRPSSGNDVDAGITAVKKAYLRGTPVPSGRYNGPQPAVVPATVARAAAAARLETALCNLQAPPHRRGLENDYRAGTFADHLAPMLCGGSIWDGQPLNGAHWATALSTPLLGLGAFAGGPPRVRGGVSQIQPR
jgi:hypothetical protein